MKAATKRKIPSLEEQVQALLEQCNDEQLGRVVRIVQERVQAEIDRLAEARRPRGIGAVPAGVIRQLWMAKAGGNTFEAFLVALQESS